MVATYKQLRETLQQHRQTLIDEMAALDEQGKEPLIGYKTHQADAGTYAFDQAADLAARNHAAHVLREVEDALARFEKGTYGICMDCETKIDIARLEAIPHTQVCLRCAEKRDFKAGR